MLPTVETECHNTAQNKNELKSVVNEPSNIGKYIRRWILIDGSRSCFAFLQIGFDVVELFLELVELIFHLRDPVFNDIELA